MKHRIEEILSATRGDWPEAPGGLEIGGWSIDSRTISAGDLFFAIEGDQLDGHAFVEQAFAGGAAAAVVRRDFTREDGSVEGLIRVDNTLDALHDLAAWSRTEEPGLRVIGVTGSCGKTTTKDIAAALLSGAFAVGCNTGNFNNIWGLPIELLRRPAGCDLYVCEMGMSYPGELSRITRIARPDVAVFTNIHNVHRAHFSSLQEIAEAKAELLEGVPADGIVVANADDPEVMRIAVGSGRRVIRFGVRDGIEVSARDIENAGSDGVHCTIAFPGDETKLHAPWPGVHNLYNLMAALAACIAVDADPRGALSRIGDAALSPMRSAIVQFEDGWTLLDDSYNSNPAALRGVLSVLAASKQFKRRIAVLGDMLELGDEEAKEHWLVGEHLASLGIERLFTIGPLAVNVARGAMAAGMPGRAVSCFETVDEVMDALDSEIRNGDLVLVKGSRGMRMERIVAELKRRRQMSTVTER